MLKLIIIVIGFLLTELKALDFLYNFQIKEYRFDRFAAMIKDRGFVQTFFSVEKLPAKSPRNLLAASAATVLLLGWAAISSMNSFLLAGTFAGYWVLAFAAAAVGVVLTWAPSAVRKSMIIHLASLKIRRRPLKVIGITGSYGKTTTKEYLADILSQKFIIAKTPHNMNTDSGVAMSVLSEIEPTTQFFIAEMGAYKPGEIRDICRMVHPRYAIITAIGNQHLHLFGSREALVKAKKELLESLPKEGKAYVNAGRAPLNQLATGLKATVVPYRAAERGINLNAFNLPPEIIRENLIPCILLARDLGLTEQEIRNGILAIKNKRQRLTPQKGKNGTVIIDNSYNTNKEGCIYSIGVLANRHEQYRILVTRGIIELGREKQSTYQSILHVLAKTDVHLFTTDADFGRVPSPNVRVFESEDKMKDAILAKLGPKTVILMEGKMTGDFISFLKTK